MLTSAGAGLLTGLSLIIAIGAQNAFVLRQGLARQHVGIVVAICAVSDLVLILAGVSGIGVVVEEAPWAIDVVRWLGVAFLTAYGVLSLLRARKADTLEAARQGPATMARAATTAVALTWLNPHVYLDTVLLLGSIANTHDSRWWFAAGASRGEPRCGSPDSATAPASRTGCSSSARAWQVLDVLIGLTMLGIAVMLGDLLGCRP